MNFGKQPLTLIDMPKKPIQQDEEDVQMIGEEQGSEPSDQSDGGVTLSPGKRKRSVNEEDLEIDLALPEPPNKKALRKAKKLKKHGKSEDDQSKPAADEAQAAASAQTSNPSEATGEHTRESKPVKPKSAYSIWIGNLPFSATKAMLTDFFTSNSQPPISKDSITRIHIPAPANAKATRTSIKPLCKGFAYVDFADFPSFTAALALSETPMAGRNTLIKDAKSFEGRPAEHVAKQESGTNKIVSRRVFVGNLGFDVTVADLEGLFAKCGTIEHVHMATFEDSGKCKGFAWITFTDEYAAQAAVKGVVIEEVKNDRGGADEKENGEEVTDVEQKKSKRKPKKRQWWCNRLNGREVRREFAEDSSVRYNKRFGKGSQRNTRQAGSLEEAQEPPPIVEEEQTATDNAEHRSSNGIQPGAPTDQSKRRGRSDFTPQQKAAYDKRQKETAERTRYRSGQVAESEGTKVTFD